MKNDLPKNSENTHTIFSKNPVLLFFCLLSCFQSFAQYNVRITVTDPSKKNEIFLAGTFNNWNPRDSSYKLTTLDATHKYIILKNIPGGRYEFKFTQGGWNSVETTAGGIGIDNRVLEIRKDTSIQLHIGGWFNDFNTSNISQSARFTVRFNLYDPTHRNEIFLTGNFSNWNPGDDRYKLTTLDSMHKFIVLKGIHPGRYQFKFTRGNWSTVESNAAGFDIDDRQIEIRSDTTLQLSITAWLDDYFDLSRFPDTTRITAGWQRSAFYGETNLDSSYKYAMGSYNLSTKIDNKKLEVGSLLILTQVLEKQGNLDKALELLLQAEPVAESLNNFFFRAGLYNSIGNIFKSENEYNKAKIYFGNVLKYMPEDDMTALLRPSASSSLGQIYFNESKLDSAKYYAIKSNKMVPSVRAFLLLGDIEKRTGNKAQAMINYRESVRVGALTTNSSSDMAESYERIAQEFTENSQYDSGFYYARLSLAIANRVKDPFGIASSSSLLSKLFETGKRFDSAFFYQQIALKANDSLYNQEKQKQIHTLLFNDQLHKQEIAAEKEKLRSRTWIYALLGGLVVLLVTAVLLIRNNKQKKNANALLQLQKEKVETTLSELKSTQAQLIQSEKMASLGVLTAGIAHEIQNPLNFVNNFSELSNELIEELRNEKSKEKRNENLESELLNDISENLEKINLHGKRASDIVKGMLQHSRTSTGKKEPTDINALCDEYLRLSYHGLRAKDKDFNATIKTDFDESIRKINIIPQDIGRVILNLINNAFYAITEKKKATGENYEPTLSVSTKKISDKVVISVADNGNGIPQKIVDKIFQPFFTTKPTGQGTGLGLSLSYDIIKAHGGEIRAETKEDEGTTFIIQLPA